MSSEDSKHPQLQPEHQKKRPRRTRKDQQGRDYVCTCGKSYLSYPALYTHVKTKHGATKVGNGVGAAANSNEVAQKMTADDQEKAVVKEDLQPLKNILSKFYPQRIRGSSITQLQLILDDQQKQFIIPLLQYWQSQQKSQKPPQSPYPSARKSMGRFIFDMNKRTNPQSIKFLTRLMMQIMAGVCKQKENDRYCDQCTASLIPSLFNQLVINGHIPVPIGNSNTGERENCQKIMQDSDAVCRILMYFCNWLFNQKYTNYSVKYKQ